jgi:hypothetical protein
VDRRVAVVRDSLNVVSGVLATLTPTGTAGRRRQKEQGEVAGDSGGTESDTPRRGARFERQPLQTEHSGVESERVPNYRLVYGNVVICK